MHERAPDAGGPGPADAGDQEAGQGSADDPQRALLEVLNESQAAAKIGTWWLSLPDQRFQWTAETFRIFELDPADGAPATETVLARIHPEDREFAVRQAAAQIDPAFEGTARYEYRIVLPGGAVKTLEHIGRAQRDEQGRVWRVIGTIQDVTERREAERRLAASEATLRSYVEAAPDGIFVVDQRGRYVEVNEAACRITGYSREELVGRSLHSLLPPERHELGKEHFGRAGREGRATGEGRFVHKSGELRHWTVDAVKLSDTRLLGFVRDITETRKMAEQLRQAEKMQVVGQLAGGVAHDFNNQLAGILGFAELLREEIAASPLLTEYVDNIITGARRAADLTAQLLAFSRKGKYIETIVDLHGIVDEVVSLLQRSIDKRIVIKQQLEARPATTSGDPTQLQNAVLNLALNARDAMPEGGELLFATDVVDVAGSSERHLRLRVADSGTGIDEQTRERIFEPFFTTKEQGKGTGMGLAAVYGTVRGHGGTIAVESEVGAGSTFVVHLPLVTPRAAPAETASAPRHAAGSAHVLLVDDERIVRDVGLRMLRSLGHTVTVCADGVEAAGVYRERWREIDLVILDVIMPRMDGEQAFAALREINPEVAVLVSSGYAIGGKAQGIVAAGARGFIQKPFRMHELSARLAEILPAD